MLDDSQIDEMGETFIAFLSTPTNDLRGFLKSHPTYSTARL